MGTASTQLTQASSFPSYDCLPRDSRQAMLGAPRSPFVLICILSASPITFGVSPFSSRKTRLLANHFSDHRTLRNRKPPLEATELLVVWKQQCSQRAPSQHWRVFPTARHCAGTIYRYHFIQLLQPSEAGYRYYLHFTEETEVQKG
mgnify:CR=1 FL=1